MSTGDNLVQTWTFIKRFRLEISLLLRLAVWFARIKLWPQFSKKSQCVCDYACLILDTCFSVSAKDILSISNVWCYWKTMSLLGHQARAPNSLICHFLWELSFESVFGLKWLETELGLKCDLNCMWRAACFLSSVSGRDHYLFLHNPIELAICDCLLKNKKCLCHYIKHLVFLNT